MKKTTLKEKIEKLKLNPKFRYLKLAVSYSEEEEKEWEELIKSFCTDTHKPESKP